MGKNLIILGANFEKNFVSVTNNPLLIWEQGSVDPYAGPVELNNRIRANVFFKPGHLKCSVSEDYDVAMFDAYNYKLLTERFKKNFELDISNARNYYIVVRKSDNAVFAPSDADNSSIHVIFKYETFDV